MSKSSLVDSIVTSIMRPASGSGMTDVAPKRKLISFMRGGKLVSFYAKAPTKSSKLKSAMKNSNVPKSTKPLKFKKRSSAEELAYQILKSKANMKTEKKRDTVKSATKAIKKQQKSTAKQQAISQALGDVIQNIDLSALAPSVHVPIHKELKESEFDPADLPVPSFVGIRDRSTSPGRRSSRVRRLTPSKHRTPKTERRSKMSLTRIK